VKNLRKYYAIEVTTIVAAVILLCGLIRPADANVADCISGPLGTGNPGGCTDADRKHYEELQKEADAEALTEKAKMLNCINDSNAPTDKCPAEYRQIIYEVNAASMAKQQHEYEIWQQGAEARRLDRQAQQAALLKQELADGEKQRRVEARQRNEDEERRDAAQLHERQAALQRGVDEEISRMNQYDAERAAQRAQQQTAERQAQQIAEQRPRPVVPVRPDPLAPAPTPAQTPESRRAAGLPDDPNAAACIQDADCARTVLPKH
jgi:hypothetical protein